MRKIGMAVCRESNQGCAHKISAPPAPKYSAPPAPKYSVAPAPKILSAPSHRTISSQSFDVPDRYAEQIRLGREWEERIECLNEKYNLDYYSSSESDSSSSPEPDHRYEHKYDTLI